MESIEFWAQSHSDALHPGDRGDCEHCQEMICAFGPMPAKWEILDAVHEFTRLLRSQHVRTKLNIPAGLRWDVWERDNFTCQKCGVRRYLTVDHIKPESRGGTLELSNLQTLCVRCNCKKGARWREV